MRYLLLVLIFISGSVSAHQWTPTYPEFRPSYVDGVLTTKMKLFNTRQDVDYYEIQVMDEDMRPVDFATTDRIVHAPYLSKRIVDVYIGAHDQGRVMYVCTMSKLLVAGSNGTSVASRVCSKVKNAISIGDITAQ